MKIINHLFILLLVSLLVTAGCTSEDDAAEGVTPVLNDASAVYPEETLTISPDNTPEEQDISSLIVGNWKIETGDSQVLYWEINSDGTMTGGSEPGSTRISGKWSTFGFGEFILINAAGTTDNGEQIAYDMAITRDPADGTITVDNPDEYVNWEFIRQV
jgi:hypothetical protein